MTAQIIRLHRETDANVMTLESITAGCQALEAMHGTIRMMREAAEKMETERVALRPDVRTMLTRTAQHLFEIEYVILSSRNTAAYCKTQLKEMGQ